MIDYITQLQNDSNNTAQTNDFGLQLPRNFYKKEAQLWNSERSSKSQFIIIIEQLLTIKKKDIEPVSYFLA